MRVLATLQYKDHEFDLDLPADVPVQELLIGIASFADATISNNLQEFGLSAKPSRALLNPDKTLAELGVWDGSFLQITRVDKTRGSSSSRQDKENLRRLAVEWEPIRLPENIKLSLGTPDSSETLPEETDFSEIELEQEPDSLPRHSLATMEDDDESKTSGYVMKRLD